MQSLLASVAQFQAQLPLLLTVVIIALGILLFVRETFAVDVTALVIMTAFIVTGVLAPEEGFAGFTNPATTTVGCMFVLSYALFKSGLLDPLIRLLIRLGRWHFPAALVALLLFATICSAFINDTAVVALLMPAALRLAERSGVAPSKVLMPLSFAALLGGACTLIGTSTNVLVSGIAEKQGYAPFGMFEFSQAAVWITLLGVVYMLTIGLVLLPSRRTGSSVPASSSTYVAWVRVEAGAADVGRTIAASGLRREFEAQVVLLRRGDGSRTREPEDSTVLAAGDELTVVLGLERLRELRRAAGYRIVTDEREQGEPSASRLFEVVVPRGSWLAGLRSNSRVFRHEVGQSLIGVRRDPRFLDADPGATRFAEGDMLLIATSESNMFRLSEEDALTIIDEYGDAPFDGVKAAKALTVLVGVVAAAATGFAPIVITALVGVIALLLTRVITPDEAYRAIEWKVIFLLAGVLSMGTALQKTGGDLLVANALQGMIGNSDPRIALGAVFGATFLATNVMSNNATAALMTPIALQLSKAMGVSERPFLIAIMFAASFAFMTPMGYQTNTMIYVPGGYRFSDYVKVGTPLNVLTWIVSMIVIPLYFPFTIV
ncbi:MAG: SLC13 family permease [Planctomycetes bacterium]|nr:SLC13 family permease [Planctomycetota bacterium]